MYKKRISTLQFSIFLLTFLASCAIQKVKIDLTNPPLPIEHLSSQERETLIQQKITYFSEIKSTPESNLEEKLNTALTLGFLYWQNKKPAQSRHYLSFILPYSSYTFRDYAYFYLGQIALEEKNCSLAAVYHETLEKEFQESPVLPRFSDLIDKECKALFVEIPQAAKELTRFQTMSLFDEAMIYFDKREYPNAILKFKSFLMKSPKDAPKIEEALVTLSTIYKRSGDDINFEKTLWKLARMNPQDLKKFPYNPKWLYEVSKFYWNKEKILAAKKYVLKLAQWPDHKYLGQSFFILAKLAADEKKFEKAASYLNKASDYPLVTTRRDEIEYLKGWYFYKANKLSEAIRTFNDFISDYDESDYLNTVKYWLARLYEKKGDSALAKPLYEILIKDNPYSYYAVRSFNRLQKKPLVKNISQVETMQFSKNYLRLLKPHIFDRAQKLLQLGLGEDGSQELALSASFEDVFKANWKFQYYLSSLFQTGGDYVSSFVILGQLQKEYLDDLPDQFLYLLYPRRYWSIIETYSKKFHVDPYLVLSIMRQESAFDLNAISGADAYGLMQMTPTVAREMGRRMKIPLKDPKDLLDPKTNIQYCTYYLSDILKRKKGNWVLALAIYNSNDAAVQKWVSNLWGEDMEAFIEEIPYQETRNYVKLILRNYTQYKWLYTGEYVAYP